MKKIFYRFCALLLMPFMLVFNCPVPAIGTDAVSLVIDIEITHDPVEKVVAGQRIMLDAEVEDGTGIEVVRVYFKAAEAAEFNFVELEAIENDTYKGKLPAPANGTGGIDYLLLIKNGNNQVVKSQTYRIEIENDVDAPQHVANNEQINVYTELQQAPAEITGFSDNIAIVAVGPAAKLGVIAGIYSDAAAGISTNDAVGRGTVVASTGGISKTAIIIGSVVAGAAILGIAASGGGGGGGGDELTLQTILGTWNVRESFPDGTTINYTVIFYENGRYNTSFNAPGRWSLSGTTLSLLPDHISSVWRGTVSGNAKAFTATGRTTVYFAR